MALVSITSPHAKGSLNTARVMQQVLLATVPGLLALTVFFGWGTLINCVIAVLTALACEAAILSARNKPVGFYLGDYSAAVTAVLLGLALPPLAPWWIVVVGTAFAIIVAKHLYGGLGYNPFNPAMVGYVFLLISFPVPMTAWPAPYPILPEGAHLPGLWESLQIVFPFLSSGMSSALSPENVDAYTAATALDIVKHNHAIMLDQLFAEEALFVKGELVASGWEWVNLGFLAGGLFLLSRKIFTWHAPIAMLVALSVLSLVFYDGGSSESKGSPLFHLLSGGT
ncbi:MAG: RnfABCDGE type electron transport complex subunit D, partial [bacterium]